MVDSLFENMVIKQKLKFTTRSTFKLIHKIWAYYIVMQNTNKKRLVHWGLGLLSVDGCPIELVDRAQVNNLIKVLTKILPKTLARILSKAVTSSGVATSKDLFKNPFIHLKQNLNGNSLDSILNSLIFKDYLFIF